MDPRTKSLARVLTAYSAQLTPGDRVLIEAEPAAEPLIRALFEEALEAGAHPHLLISLSGLVSHTGLDDLFLRKASPEQLDHGAPFYEMAYAEFEARIRIHSYSNTKALTSVDPERISRRKKATKAILESQLTRGARDEFRWVTTQFPTPAYAQDAEMSLEEYQEFLYTACAVQDAEVDPVAYWVNVQEAQQRVIEGLAGHAEVTVRSENCDLKLSIEGRKFVNACGRHNMPDGEIYTSPVEDSVNGWIRFTYPAVYRGTEVAGVELQFEAGRVVKAKAEKNQAFLDKMLETDQGSRYLGEFALGTNQGVQRFTRNILFDEKIGGSIHLALGAGYPETGSKNQSAIHWDMICDVRQNAEIRVDGELFYQDGKFVI